MTDHQRAQVTMAAASGISGTLKDWPDLYTTLEELGVLVDETMPANDVQEICRRLLMNEER